MNWLLFALNFCLLHLAYPQDAKALNVIIDPGLAFGTGEHPTTRLCLQWLHHVVSPGDKILDYGTGSGILSIAALKVIFFGSMSLLLVSFTLLLYGALL